MNSNKVAFFFDSSSCSGCKTCQVACRDKHNTGKGMIWRKVYEIAGGEWEKRGNSWVNNISSYYLSVSCNHCLNALCLSACPNKALYRNSAGLVLIDEKRCMGCRYCEWACPYNALVFDKEAKVMTKCTMCADYMERGKQPACVTACPMRALETADLSLLESRELNNYHVFPLPDSKITNPAIVVRPHKNFSKENSDRYRINNMEEVKHNG